MDLGGSPVDLGGAWIHTPDGNPMSALAERLGVGRTPVEFLDDVVLLGADGRHGPLAPLLPVVDAFYRWLDRERASLGSSLSLADAIDRFLEVAEGLGPGERELTRRFLRAQSTAENAWPPEDAAALGYPPNTVEYGGSPLGDYPDGGYRRILEGLAYGLDVRTAHPVSEIRRGDDGVAAICPAADAPVEGSHVVVTVPLGVLKDPDAIAFSPPLPPERRTVIDRLGFGRFEKLILRFDAATWGGPAPIAVAPDAGTSDWLICFELRAHTGVPALVAFTTGPAAERVLARPLDERVDEVLGLVRSAGVTDLGLPSDVVASSWATDPFTRGAYGFVRLGSSREDLDRLGEPIDERLLFAGEATGSARAGFADGALLTGIREAKRLLGTAEVTLGRTGG